MTSMEQTEHLTNSLFYYYRALWVTLNISWKGEQRGRKQTNYLINFQPSHLKITRQMPFYPSIIFFIWHFTHSFKKAEFRSQQIFMELSVHIQEYLLKMRDGCCFYYISLWGFLRRNRMIEYHLKVYCQPHDQRVKMKGS